MSAFVRPRLPLLLVVLASIMFMAACGGEDEDRSTADTSPATAATTEERPSAKQLADKSSSDLKDEAAACMETAGYVEDAPPTAALRAWRHPEGARAVIASEATDSVTSGIAAEIEGGQYTATITGTVVIAGPDPAAAAAAQCLE